MRRWREAAQRAGGGAGRAPPVLSEAELVHVVEVVAALVSEIGAEELHRVGGDAEEFRAGQNRLGRRRELLLVSGFIVHIEAVLRRTIWRGYSRTGT